MRQDQAFERRIMEGFKRSRHRAGGREDAKIVRGGMDSLAWLVRNVDHRDDPRWAQRVRAAFEDRERAIEALERLAPGYADEGTER